MAGFRIRPIDERVFAVDHLEIALTDIQRVDVGAILPHFGTARADVSEELARVTPMKVANRSGQHYDVTQRQVTSQKKLPRSRGVYGPTTISERKFHGDGRFTHGSPTITQIW
jgi:hypothetical protein